jgi:hypothetical protein
MRNRLAPVLLISVLFLLFFAVLFLGRAADDNSLFSWAWVFAPIDSSRIYLLLVVGLVLSSFLSRTALPDNYQIPFLAVLSFAVILPFWNESELIVDSSRYFTQAKYLEIYGIGYFLREWGRTIPAWTDMPLVPFLYGLIFKLFGESRLAIQLFTTALFSLTTVFTYLIGRTLWNRETGFSAGLLLLGIPYLMTQVPLMLVDVPTMFFLTLAIYAFLVAVDKGGAVRILFSSAAIVFFVLSKYSAWFMLSVLGVVLIVYSIGRDGSEDRRPLLRGSLILFMAAALSGVILLLKFDVVSEQLHLLRDYQRPGLTRWEESFHSTFLFQVHPIITISAAASLVVALRKRDARYAIISWLVTLAILFGIRRIRYTLPLFPMLTLMAAYGLQVIRRDELRRFILCGTVATSLVIGIFAYLPLAESMSAANLKRAGEYLNTLGPGDIEVITLASGKPVANPAVAVPLLDLFTNRHVRYRYHQEGSLPREEIERSSLRFTWEYRNPAYYSAGPHAMVNIPVVVISEASNSPLPQTIADRLEGYQLSKAFNASEKIFQYSVGVRIYQRTSSSPVPDTRE